MYYTKTYESPIGKLQLVADEKNLIGIWYNHQNFKVGKTENQFKEYPNHSILKDTTNWLNQYFSGQQPNINQLPILLEGTEFQKQVWNILLKIPYGSLVTYGDIAKEVAKLRNIDYMSSQAVGGAVGRNPISIIVPCHRVIGTNGNLTGYGGGLDKKVQLLKIENIETSHLYLPK